LYAFDKMRSNSAKPPSLTLANCSFKYFVNTHDALIQIETNNLGIMGEKNDSSDKRTLAFYGEDRGGQVTIDGSSFTSSSFCKGLVYYSTFQPITYSESPTLLNYTANAVNQTGVDSKIPDGENFIKITNSTFKNLGFQQVIRALRLKDASTLTSNEKFASGINFRRFMDQGLILNLKGYSGTVFVKENTFSKNMAYIQEILIHENQKTTQFYKFNDEEMKVAYGGTNGVESHLQFKICVN